MPSMRTNLLEKFCLRFPRLAIQLHIGHVKNESLLKDTYSMDDFPEEMHDVVHRHAAYLGMSTSEYLRYLALPPEEKMSFSEWLSKRNPEFMVDLGPEEVLKIVQEAREERDFSNDELMRDIRSRHVGD